jgi:hypothetical protein
MDTENPIWRFRLLNNNFKVWDYIDRYVIGPIQVGWCLGSNITKGIKPTGLFMKTTNQNFHYVYQNLHYVPWLIFEKIFNLFYYGSYFTVFSFLKCCIKYALDDLCNPFIVSSFKVEVKYCFHAEDEWCYFKITAGQWPSWENCIVKKLLTSHKFCALDEHIL